MSEQPQLWILVGGNGSGKSTFYRLALEPLDLPFVNADLLARIVFPTPLTIEAELRGSAPAG